MAIVGGGSIGVAWAIVFARAGFVVSLFESDPARRARIADEVGQRLDALNENELLTEAVSDISRRVAVATDLDHAVSSAVHVQECVPEVIDLKREIFSNVLRVADAATTIASSSSAIAISEVAAELRGNSRCMVAHPGNPPYLVPVVEVVPAPFTAPEAVDLVMRLMSGSGMVPVRVDREVEGFVFNRLQGALLREAYCLVRDGVATPTAIDLIVTAGLGRRWSVIGPFATAELNTRGGIRAHAERLGPAYARMGAERGQDDPWTPDLVEQVAKDLESRYPPSRWEEHVIQRDFELMRLEADRRRSLGRTTNGRP